MKIGMYIPIFHGIAHYHGNILNAEELSRSLSINNKGIRHYLDILTDTFMVRQLQLW